MTSYSDEVVLDPAELRDVANTLRGAGSNLADLASRLPVDVPDAPWWVVEQVGDELWRIRTECAELTDELAAAARELEARAGEVETSDRTYDLVDGRLRSCCRLADGTIVTVGGETSVITSGAIVGLVPVTIGASAVGEAAWGSGVGGGWTTLGGGGEILAGSGGGLGGGAATRIGGGVFTPGDGGVFTNDTILMPRTDGGYTTTIGSPYDVTITNVEIPGLDPATISGGETRIAPSASTSQPFPSPYSGVPGPYGVMTRILNAGTYTDSLVNS